MRIALFTETYLSDISGVVTHVKSLTDGLQKLGHQVLVVTADAKATRHYVEDGVLHCPARRVKRLYGYGVALPISSRRLKYIREFDPDVMHIHTEFGIGLSGVTAAKLLKKPLVYTLHTMYDNYIYYIAPKPFIKATTYFSHKYLKILANSASALTGPSKKCEEYLKKVGVHKDVTVIRNPVELDLFRAEPADSLLEKNFRDTYGISPETMLTCFVGRLGFEKNVETLLRYWAQTLRQEDGIHLVVIGEGPALEPLKALAEEIGIAGMLTFTGMMVHEKLPLYYRMCKAYVTASLTDTNSISMLEGMATGLPVLQIYDRLNEDQIQEGVNGFVFHTAEEMAEKLRYIKNLTDEEFASLRQSVLESAKNNGSEIVAYKMLGIYENCMMSEMAGK